MDMLRKVAESCVWGRLRTFACKSMNADRQDWYTLDNQEMGVIRFNPKVV